MRKYIGLLIAILMLALALPGCNPQPSPTAPGAFPTPISLLGDASTYYIASVNATTLEKARANVLCDGTADQTDINTGLANYTYVVTSSGGFNCSGNITLRSGVQWIGHNSQLMFSGGRILGTDVSNVEIGGIRVTGTYDPYPSYEIGGIEFRATSDNISNIYVHDTKVEILNTLAAFYFATSTGMNLSHIRVERSQALSTDGFGFLNHQQEAPSTWTDISWTDLYAYRTGIAATRENDAVCAFDPAEGSVNMTLTGVVLTRCYADTTWYEGFHEEVAPTKGISYTDCYNKDDMQGSSEPVVFPFTNHDGSFSYTRGSYQSGLYTSTIAVDWTNGNSQTLTLGSGSSNVTMSGGAAGSRMVLKVIQPAGGDGTISWGATVKWPAGTAPTLTATNAAVDLVAILYDGTNYYGSVVNDLR